MQKGLRPLFIKADLSDFRTIYRFLHNIGLLVGVSQMLAITHLASVLQIGQFSETDLGFYQKRGC